MPETVPGNARDAFTVVDPPAVTDLLVWIEVPYPEAEMRTS